jgi:UDP-glucose 4-epimerase
VLSERSREHGRIILASVAGRALVTGGAGFVGSHVVDAFRERRYETLAVDDLSTGRRENVTGDLEVLDIRNGDALGRVAGGFRPTVVAHLAAQASVTRSVREPALDLDVNVHGTLNVLEAAREAGAGVVFASTGGALYGEEAELPTPEHSATQPLSPYGASKLAGEAYLGTWSRLHGLPNVVLRLANVYGPRQAPHGEAGVVAIFSELLAHGGTPTVYGDGEQTRDYTHVADVARAFVLAAECGRAATYNVGTGVETSVNRLLELLQSAAGTNVVPERAPLRAGELLRSALDAGAIGRDLGWRAETPVEAGLEQTYRTYVSG